MPLRRPLRFEPLEERRLLAVVSVTTLDDTVDFNDGVTSLREAIFATNLVGGADTIQFAAALTSGGPATLILTQGELKITDALSIIGPGADRLTIDASGNDPTPNSTLDDGDDLNDGDGSRVFNVDDGNVNTHKTVSIRGLTLTGGDVLGNGGAIRSLENLAVTESTISDNSAGVGFHSNGGGIYSYDGNLSVIDSTISGNSASGEFSGSGGGIFNYSGNMTVTGSTIIGNSARHYGGGVYSGDNGMLTVARSTISDNYGRIGGGGIDAYHVTITDSTIRDNTASGFLGGGGAIKGTHVTVTNSTISGNSALGERYSRGGGIVGRGYGGTVTVILSTISGNSATDGGGGGIYMEHTSTLMVSQSTISGNSAGGGGGILGQNISSNIMVAESTISDNSANYGGGIWGGEVTVTDSMISGNAARSDGGGIGGGNVAVTDSMISGNQAGGSGGGISGGGNVTVTNSSISGNSADVRGGGISGRNVAVINCMISGNSAVAQGGGIHGRYNVTVTNSTISGNSSANGSGGGIYGTNYSTQVTVTDSTISDNSARYDGGGIYGRGVTVSGSTISGNSARHGGGIFSNSYVHLLVTDSTISGNSASGSGGGINNRYSALTVTSSTISNNSADSSGGGIFSYAVGNVTVTDSTISGNRTYNGNGGGLYSRLSDVTMTGSTLSGNRTYNGNGGGLYVFDAASAMRHSTITGNQSGASGGGAFIAGGTLTLDHTILAGNYAALGPDLTGLIGSTFDVRFSLIGDNAHSGLAATPTLTPDANGNLIGPAVPVEALKVSFDVAAMGDFEAGPGGDSFLFEYSIDGGAFQPLFTSSVDEEASQTYFMDNGIFMVNGTQVVLDDPLSVNGVVLNRYFQTISAAIPGGGTQIRLRFTATNDGPSEAFAWRKLVIVGESSFFSFSVGAAVMFDVSADSFATYVADPDYTISGDMFGIRSRSNPGIPGLPSDIVDDSPSIFPGDTQGIVSEFHVARFFGVVDTVNGVGSNTNTATWTFNNNLLVPIDPLLGPLADNGGPTLTHALLPGSRAIDAGDPAAVAGMNGVPEFDQRGAPSTRVAGGRIDIGAFELPPLPPALLGDYNLNGIVDAADYTVWRNTLNANVAPYSGADGSGNGVVDPADCGVWKAHFGQTLPPLGASSGAIAVAAPADFGELDSTELAEVSRVEPAAPPAIAASQPSTLSDDGAAARSARGAALPPADAVFTMLGQQAPARSMATRTALRSATVDAAVSDSLLLFRRRRVDPTPGDDAVRVDGGPRHDTDSRREPMDGLGDKWIRAGRGSLKPTQIVVG
jgi:hypothetical protein